MVFNEVLLSDGTARPISLQILFLWSLITISGELAAISLSVCICIPQSIVACLIFSDGRCFMFIPLVQHLDVVVLTCFPMYTCNYLVVSLNILKFRTARHNVVYCFFVSVAYPAH